MVNSNKDKLEH